MSQELDQAITTLDGEIGALGFPKEDTIAWWRLRALSTGLSLLRTMQQRNLTNIEADRFRKGVRSGLMKTDTPDVIEMAAVAKPITAEVTP